MVQLRLMELMPETQEMRVTAREALPPRLLLPRRRVCRLSLLRRRVHRLPYRLLLLRRRAQRLRQVTAGRTGTTRTTGATTGTETVTTGTGMATTGTGMETRASSGVTSDL